MSWRSFHDPNYKADRTPAKYRTDKRKDANSLAETRNFIQGFLASWVRAPAGAVNPQAVLKALRVEARQLKLGRKRTSVKGTSKKTKRRTSIAKDTARPFLRRKSSLKYWHTSEEDLLESYRVCQLKIDRWREERENIFDEKQKAKLAEQVQVQLAIRADLLTVVHERAFSWQ